MAALVRKVLCCSMIAFVVTLGAIMMMAHERHQRILDLRGRARTDVLESLLSEEVDPAEPKGDLEILCPQNISTVLLQSVLEEDENASLVDIRSSVEYQQGHPPGAVNVPAFATGGSRQFLSTFLSRFNASVPDKDSAVFIVSDCADYTFECLWSRELQASSFLCEAGYKNVSWVKGGLNEWRQLKMPLKLGM
jgi:rhodanese-related sulfurtransferase